MTKVNQILQQNKDIYNTIASDFSDTRYRLWLGLEKLRELVKSGDAVLDVGCGNGRLAEVFSDGQVSYLGLDISENLIEIAKNKWAPKTGISFEVGDILHLEKFVNNYNLVLSIAVLHHIPGKKSQLEAISQLAKATKSGGQVVIWTWNILAWRQLKLYWKYFFNFKERMVNGCWSLGDFFIPWKRTGATQWRYVHSFGKGELATLLKLSGLELEEIYFQNKSGERTGLLGGENLVVIARKK